MFAALAARAAQDVEAGHTVLVAGDFNIPLNDPRSGRLLGEDNDCNPSRSCSMPVDDLQCSGRDGLDDSHFLISGGLINDFEMAPLSASLTETLLGEFSSAVDHIYGPGPGISPGLEAGVDRDANGGGFGSDHLPVSVTIDVSAGAPQ